MLRHCRKQHAGSNFIMWTELRKEIEKVRTDFGLTTAFRPTGLNEWKDVEDKVYSTFCDIRHYKTRPVWIWENLKGEIFSVSGDNQSYNQLDKIIDDNEQLFILLNESVNMSDKFWIYESTIKPLQTIISESVYIDEVTIVDKKFNWILCINHHDNIIVSGQKITERLKQFQTT
jgi:hypothetical protein